MKVGKFETLLGVEHLQASESFFYSRSNLFYTEPQTHTGALFEYRADDSLWFSFGYVNGADSSFQNKFHESGVLAGIYWRPVRPLTVWYTIYSADRGSGFYRNGEFHPGGSIFQHTLALNWDINNRLKYTFQWDYGQRNEDRGYPASHYYGIANFLTYDICRHVGIGLRADWVHSSDFMGASGFGRPYTGFYNGDLYGLTLGLNWRPFERLSIRPELRYDRAADCRPFDDGKKQDQFSAGMGAVYQF